MRDLLSEEAHLCTETVFSKLLVRLASPWPEMQQTTAPALQETPII